MSGLRWASAAGEPLQKTLIPALGFGVSIALFRFELWLPALVMLILAVGVGLVADPRVRRNPRLMFTSGTLVRTTSEAEYEQRNPLLFLFVPSAALAASWVLEPVATAPEITVPLTFLALTVTSAWAFLRIMNSSTHPGRKRMQAAMKKEPLESATRPLIEAISTPPRRKLTQALVKIGAVDGIQARFWLLSEVSGLPLEQLQQECRELAHLGLVRNSGIDAGEDLSRHLTELTPVGLRALVESRPR
ncbi:hypothetical protein [Corynebacterium sp. A21]|uniref:hypothetical protein n=1 Tax=Corynebacterium sp. A21 TaxID=3457318 RepID=UPI003FD26731